MPIAFAMYGRGPGVWRRWWYVTVLFGYPGVVWRFLNKASAWRWLREASKTADFRRYR